MEDPVRFDIWCVVIPGHANEATDAIRRSTPNRREIDVRLDVNRSIVHGLPIRVHSGVAWQVATTFRGALPRWVVSCKICQEEWTPDDKSLHYCGQHDFYYGGVLGCHVCTGFYVAE